MKSKFFAFFLTVCALLSNLNAQILLPDKFEPFAPIIVSCAAIVPDKAEVQIIWRTDDASNTYVSDCEKKLFVWAPPGDHWIEALVVIRVYKEVQVIKQDTFNPSDSSKWQFETIKVIDSVHVQRYDKKFSVSGVVPPSPIPPTPTPPTPTPVPPEPVEPFAAKVREWLKAVPSANYSKEKALAIADNYAAVAAQAVATQDRWNLEAFVNATKERNRNSLSTEDILAWGPTFFNPLAKYQSDLFNSQGLNVNDKAGIAKIWVQTADAIRAAAF